MTDPYSHLAWTPPPAPGLIPLRPLSFGTLLGAPYQLLRRNPKATFGSALIIQGVVAIVTTAIMVPLASFFAGRIETASQQDQPTIIAGTVGWGILAALVLLFVSVVASALLQGVIVLEVARATLGEKLSLGELWRRVLRRILPLSAWILMLGLAFTVLFGVVVVAAVFIFAQGTVFIAIGVLFSLLALLGLAVLAAWIYTKTLFVPCAIVLEHLGLAAAVRRSWLLVRGSFWKTLGVNLLVLLMVNVATQIITTPIALVASFAVSSFDPNSTAANSWVPVVITQGVVIFVSIIVGSIASVIQSATIALLYLDLRMRGEGLDLELMRFVEQREAGYAPADPYLAAV